MHQLAFHPAVRQHHHGDDGPTVHGDQFKPAHGGGGGMIRHGIGGIVHKGGHHLAGFGDHLIGSLQFLPQCIVDLTGTLTGKGQNWGGSLLRPEATGYGACYFAQAMLATRGETFEGKTVVISGAGNVAQYAAQKAMRLGAKVVTMSDSDGYIYDADGFTEEKIDYIMWLKNAKRGRIREYAQKYPQTQYFAGERPWGVKCDIAMPCATQNEIDVKI